MVIRPLLCASIDSRVQPIAFTGICGKLPGGTPGSVPSGRFSAASDSGCPTPTMEAQLLLPLSPLRQPARPMQARAEWLPTPLLVVTWIALLREVEQGTPKRPKSYMPVPPPYVDRCRFRPSPPAEWSRIYAGTIGQVKDCPWPVPFSVQTGPIQGECQLVGTSGCDVDG